MSGEVLMQKKFGRWFYVIGGSLICVFLVGLTFLYLDYTNANRVPTIPIVSISDTFPENPVVADQSVVVFGQARDPDGIGEVQLWVNGQMIGSQTNMDPKAVLPFDVSQAWIPNGAANYLVLLRAIDGKGFAGQSEPVMVEAVERTYAHEVVEGETIESIAGAFGTTPEDINTLNPGIGGEPAQGTSINVPAPPTAEDAGSSDVPTAGEGPEEPPRVDPPEDPIPPTGDETPAEPASPGLWAFLPLPDSFICVLRPEFCSPAAEDDDPPTPAVDIGAELTDDCRVAVGWTDTTQYEMGFRIYRVSPRPFRYDMVALLAPSPGNSARLSFVDEDPPNGNFFYFVAAYDSNGEYWSTPTETLTVTCNPPDASASLSVEIEALEMTVRDSYDRLYCYASLAGSPYERIPDYGQFIEMESGAWDIATHFSGENKRVIMVRPGTPIEIVVECMGWQGDTLTNLGRFTRSHPPAEWDGRPLTASSPDGSFNVTYRIEAFIESEGEVGRSVWALEPAIPPPYNLRTAIDYRWTPPDGSPGTGTVAQISGPSLAWDFTAPGTRDWEPVDFRVYSQTETGYGRSFYYNTNSAGNLTAPQVSGGCNETVFYTVTALVREAGTGTIFESVPSEFLEVPATCGSLEITLNSFQLNRDAHDGEYILGSWGRHEGCFDDCGEEVEAYGWVEFNDFSFRWNRHCDGCTMGRVSDTTSVRPLTPVRFDLEFLQSGGGSYGTNHNVIRIPVPAGGILNMEFHFYDHDGGSSDDSLCQSWALPERSSLIQVMRVRSAEEWLALDQDFTYTDYTQDGVPQTQACEITFHIRGLP